MKGLLKKLGSALHHAMAESEDVRNISKAIREEGFNLFLVMEANIALEKNENLDKGDTLFDTPEQHVPIKLTKFDEEFLSGMQIKIDLDSDS